MDIVTAVLAGLCIGCVVVCLSLKQRLRKLERRLHLQSELLSALREYAVLVKQNLARVEHINDERYGYFDAPLHERED